MDLSLNHFRPVVRIVHLLIIISDVEGRQDVLLRRPLQTHRDWFEVNFILMSVVIVRDSMKRVCQATLSFHF